MNAEYRRGIDLFNRREFFDAHEVLEDVWRAAPGKEKLFLQGLIQLAVGLHHYSTGNVAGARSVMARGHRNLSKYPAVFGGINLAKLRHAAERCTQALDRGGVLEELPRIESAGSASAPELSTSG
jgi:predicted metal-dependent hydrolase